MQTPLSSHRARMLPSSPLPALLCFVAMLSHDSAVLNRCAAESMVAERSTGILWRYFTAVNENTGNCCGCRKAICDCGTNTTNLYKCLKTPQIREGIPQTDPDLQRRDGGYWQSPVRDAKNIQVAHLVAKVMFPS